MIFHQSISSYQMHPCGAQFMGTIDASIYSKNSNQDNSKDIIRMTHKGNSMEKANPVEIIERAIGKGKDVVGIINLSEALLRIVEGGTLTMTETLDALCSLRGSLEKNGNEGYSSMAEAIKDINADAPHQQDRLNYQDGAARELAASTHGAASHLTKTVVEGEVSGVDVQLVRGEHGHITPGCREGEDLITDGQPAQSLAVLIRGDQFGGAARPVFAHVRIIEQPPRHRLVAIWRGKRRRTASRLRLGIQHYHRTPECVVFNFQLGVTDRQRDGFAVPDIAPAELEARRHRLGPARFFGVV